MTGEEGWGKKTGCGTLEEDMQAAAHKQQDRSRVEPPTLRLVEQGVPTAPSPPTGLQSPPFDVAIHPKKAESWRWQGVRQGGRGGGRLAVPTGVPYVVHDLVHCTSSPRGGFRVRPWKAGALRSHWLAVPPGLGAASVGRSSKPRPLTHSWVAPCISARGKFALPPSCEMPRPGLPAS